MRWLLGALALLIVAVLLDLGLLAYAMYSLLGVIVLSRLAADGWSARMSAVRELNRDVVEIGDTVAVVIRIENHHWLPVPWLLLEDLLPQKVFAYNPPALQVKGRRLQLVSFRGQARKTIHYQLACVRRGYYQLGPLVAETGDVFGLYRRYRLLTEPSFLLVHPKVIPLRGFDIASRRPIGEVRMSHRLFEDPTRIAGVRAYQPGDPLGRVHWGATARTGTLHSKTYEASSIAGATIVLDFHQSSFDPSHEPVRSDLAVTAAASIASAISEMGQQVGLVTNGRDAADRIRTEGWEHSQLLSRQAALQAASMLEKSDRLRPQVVPTSRGSTQLKQILETLARIELTDGLTLPQLIREGASRIPVSASVVAILALVTPEAAIALGNLRRRGFAVTAIVNVYEDYEFAQVSSLLAAQRIETRHLRAEDSIPTLCSSYVLR